MDIIGCLPPEISQNILLYLDSNDIKVVLNGIQEWGHLFDNYFWKALCRRNDYQEDEACLSSDIYRECMAKHFLRWQAIFTYNELIQSNWASDNYKSISITNKIIYDRILYFDDEILIASQYIKRASFVYTDIIDLSTGNLYFRFDEKNIVQKIIRHRNLLIYFVKKTLKVLNLETKCWDLVLKLPEVSKISPGGIYIEVRNNLLAVLNPSEVFYVVNIETKTINFKMLGVFEACFGDTDNIIIVLLKSDKKLQVLDYNGKLLMNITYGGGLKIEHIMIKGGYVIICYSRISEQVFQKVSFSTVQQETQCLQEVRSVNMSYRMLCFPNKYTMLFWNRTGSRSSTYMIWRFGSENCFVPFDSNEKELVWAIANERYLFLYTEDCALNIWCSKTGKYIKEITMRDKVVYFYQSFKVTEKKFAYINSNYGLSVRNYDFVPK